MIANGTRLRKKTVASVSSMVVMRNSLLSLLALMLVLTPISSLSSPGPVEALPQSRYWTPVLLTRKWSSSRTIISMALLIVRQFHWYHKFSPDKLVRPASSMTNKSQHQTVQFHWVKLDVGYNFSISSKSENLKVLVQIPGLDPLGECYSKWSFPY